MQALRHYLSLIVFSHTVFALPFALIGFSLGVMDQSGPFPWNILIWVIACMVFARSAAMAFNRLIDARFDALNPRTALREIPAGIIQPSRAMMFVILNSILFVVSAAMINRLCLYLSPIALAVILIYSYTKRFTPLCHWVLGLGLALAPIGAYLAVSGKFSILPLMFSAVVFMWVSGFDILYALQDETFDREQGLKSIPVLLGRKKSLLLSRSLHTVTALLLLLIYFYFLPALFYLFGAIIFIALLVYQHSLVSVKDISRVNRAFGTTNGVASVVFALFVIVALLLQPL